VGKDRGFPVRRYLLAPGETLAVEPPAGNWGQMSGGGEFDLMRPMRLPPGRYRVWATFALRPAAGGGDAEVIESNRREYEVH
jgi:hypothetical protein